MPTTPIFALPYPTLDDPPNVPADMQELAEAVEAAVQGGKAAVPNVVVARPVTQNAVTGNWTSPSWSDIRRDDFNMHDPGTATRLTVPAGYPGLWLVTAGMDWQANAAGRRGLRFTINGGGTSFGQDLRNATSAGTVVFQTTTVLTLAAADYVEVGAFQDSGTSLTIGGTNTVMSMVYLGR